MRKFQSFKWFLKMYLSLKRTSKLQKNCFDIAYSQNWLANGTQRGLDNHQQAPPQTAMEKDKMHIAATANSLLQMTQLCAVQEVATSKDSIQNALAQSHHQIWRNGIALPVPNMARRGRCSCNNCYHFLHQTAFLPSTHVFMIVISHIFCVILLHGMGVCCQLEHFITLTCILKAF